MTDSTIDLLRKVGEFLKAVKPEELDALAAGEASLKIVLKNPPKAAKAPAALPVDAARVAADLKGISDRAAALRLLTDLKLTKPQLLSLAEQLEVAVSTKDSVAALRNAIVEQKVGSRLDSNAILGRP